MAFVHEHEHFALGAESLGQTLPDFLSVGLDILVAYLVRLAEFVDQRTHQPFDTGLQGQHQVGAAARAVDILADAFEDLFDLLVQLGAVGDDKHPAISHVLANPLRQPNHGQAFAASLGMPEDAALAALHPRLCRLHACILVVAADFLDAGVEDDEVMYHLQQPLLAAQLAQLLKQRVVPSGWMGFAFFPAQPVFLRRFNHAVAQPLGVASRHHELNRGKERLDKRLLLAVEVLAYALAHRDGRALQLQHAQGKAVDIEHEIGSPGILPGNRHLFGESEVVIGRVGPIDEPDGHVLLTQVRLDLHAVAKQPVDFTVGIVEGPATAKRCGLVEFTQHLVDGPVTVALASEPIFQRHFLNVAVALTVLPVAQAVVPEPLLKEGNDPLLGTDFPFANRTHGLSSPDFRRFTVSLPCYSEMLSFTKRVILSRFAVRLENCLSQTSLKRARTFRLIDSWSSKIASDRNGMPHLSNWCSAIVASRVLPSLDSA